jgi:hypothetical protein
VKVGICSLRRQVAIKHCPNEEEECHMWKAT